MILIPCRVCGNPLEVPQELAGTEIQCPQCKFLNDVPTLHELKQIQQDGTYVLGDNQATDDPNRLAEMVYVFAKDKTDAAGNEIDLRGPAAGEDESYKLADEPPAEMRPKYDPETGELIRPIEMMPDPSRERIDPSTIPMAQPALGYANPSTHRPISTRSAFINLLRPTNSLVWMIVFFLHLAAGLMLLACGYLGYIIGVPFVFMFIVMLMGHWANIVDEVGREERDELPRPFRDMQWYDDICHPFAAFMLALFVCYLPEQIAATWITNPKIELAARIPLGLAATYFFPAVFLITSTSGTIVNLRPDRIWGTATAAGGSYALAVLLWTPAGILYNLILWLYLAAATPAWGHLPTWVKDWRSLLGILLAGIYLMHYFCWTLGLIYREHHANFPWAFQFHKRRQDEGLGEARRRNYKRQPGISPQPLKPLAKPPKIIPTAPLPMPHSGSEAWPEIRE